jgi:predicted lipoprotein with Yx(FWY)xxD motif
MRNVKLWSAVLVLIAGSIFVVDSSLLAQRGGGNMPAGVQQSKLPDGTMILADAKGMTLYTFAKDQPGVSNCNDNCAKNWPPLTAAADAKPMGEWTIVTRADGSKQWAYKGMPVYLWIKDAKPGDNTGNGVGNGAWKTAVP